MVAIYLDLFLPCRWCEMGREDPLKALQPTFFFKLMVAILEHLDVHQRAGKPSWCTTPTFPSCHTHVLMRARLCLQVQTSRSTL